MYCPKCGSPIEDNHSYCSNCGCSLDEWGYISQHHNMSPANAPKRKASWFYVLVFTSLMLVLWGGYSSVVGIDSLSSIAKAQLNEIKSNKITKAYYEHTSNQFRKENPLEKFKEFIEENSSLTTYESISIMNSQVENKYGVVYAKLTLSDNMQTTIKFEFIKEEDEWRILGISIDKPMVSGKGVDEESDSIIQSVKTHLAALKSGDFNKAYNELSSKEFQEAINLDNFEEFVNSHPALTSEKMTNMSIIEQEDEEAKVRVLLHANAKPLPVDYLMILEDGKWKVWSLYLLSLDDDEEEESSTQEINNEILQPINAFIDNLKEGNIRQAYDSLTKKFRETTSFSQFQDFLEQFPIFTTSQEKVIKSKVSGNVGQVRVEMRSAKEESIVDYILSLEGEDWKILGIQFVEEITPIEPEGHVAPNEQTDFDYSFLTKVISDQIKQIKQRDLYSAYENYSSIQFKESTPFDNFARFIDQNEVFSKNKTIDFGYVSFDNNIATLHVLMVGDGELTEKVEYDLVKEDNDWRILSIKILNRGGTKSESDDESSKESGLVFEKIDLGTEVNLTGQITNPSTKIRSNADDIFATLFVKEGTNGTVIEVFFEHVDTKSSLPPVEKTLKEKGNSTISLVFSPPKDGWPQGKYLLKVRASTGQKKDFEFEIIE